LPEKLVLIVTCKAGSELWCVEEVGNAIFEHDPGVIVEKTKYPGLLLVYSSLDAYKAYAYAMRREYGFVKHIIPVEAVALTIDEAERAAAKLVNPGESVKVVVRVRGKRGLSGDLWNRVVNKLKLLGAKHNPESTTCLYIEVIDDKICIGKAKCV